MVEFFQDGELKAEIAAENLNAFKISIGLEPELVPGELVPGELVPGELVPIL